MRNMRNTKLKLQTLENAFWEALNIFGEDMKITALATKTRTGNIYKANYQKSVQNTQISWSNEVSISELFNYGYWSSIYISFQSHNIYPLKH